MNHKILLHLLSAILLCISAKAESTSEGEATSLTWERTWLDAVQLKWQPPTQVQSSMLDIPINDWEPAFGFNMNSNNTVTDGYRIYSGSNLLQVYDMQGNYLETIEIPGLPEIYQMTYDGKYFYGTVYERPGIFVIDLTNKKLVKVIPTKESMYHIAYIPQLDENKGGFFVGNPGRGWFCDMEGNMLNDYGSIDIQKDLGDGRFCMAAATIGEKLYIYSVKTTDRILYEYDLNTLTPTGNSFNLDDFTGMAGVETPMAGRHMFVYNYPDNKRYLMLTDYNGLKFRSTSVLTGERPLIAGLEGYNIYRNNIKINEAPIDANTWSFNDSGLEEATDYIYELRPIIEGKEQPSIARANISLDNTTTLPLLDDFSAHTLTQIHPTLQLPVNYWTIAPKLPEQKWVIYGAGDQRLQFSYSPDLKYRQTITTRPLYAQEGKNIKINIGYTGNTYLYTLPQTEGMSIDVSVDNGETWQSAGTIQYKADADKFSTAEFDLTSLVAGKKFQVRFKGYGEEPDSPYNWQFNDVKIWEYNDIDITGKINISGVSDMTNLNISLTNLDTTSETITETDNAGNFSVSNMQSGTYRLRVFNNDYTYTIDQYTFDESGNYYQIHIPQGYFQSDANPIEATVAPGDNYEIALPLQNAGDVEANILMSFDYTANGGQPIGNSDIKAEINWIPNTDFNYPQNQSSFFYFGGFLYSKSESYMATQIIRHSIDGELLETITLKPEGDFTTQPAGYFVKGDDLYAYTTPISWTTPPTPAYILPVNLDTYTIEDSRKIQLDFGADQNSLGITGIDYNPKEDVFYIMGNSNTLFKINADGTLNRTYTLPEIGYYGAAIDTFSEGGPYIWTSKPNSKRNGIQLMQYSLATEQFTQTKHEVNDYENSIFNIHAQKMPMPGIISLYGSTDAVSGHFSLILSQSASMRSGSDRQVLIYPLFPYENWIEAIAEKATIEAGGNSTINITLHADAKAIGQQKEATLNISAANFSTPISLPIKMIVDQTAKEQYRPIEKLMARTDAEYNVILSWDKPATEQPIAYYRIYRDGILMPDESVATQYIDKLPKYGVQTYAVQTIYESGYTTMSESIEIEVNDPSWGVEVDNLKADVVARRNVSLSWDGTARIPNAFYDDFESYEPFTLQPGNWKLIDADRSWTYESTRVDYDHEGEPMSGMIYNPSKTLPADDAVKAADGSSQFFLFTSGRTPALENDNWLISPQLELLAPSVFRFQASSRSATYGKEKLIAGYSITSDNPEDFIWLTEVIEVEPGWTDYEFKVPQDTKHVALRHVGLDTYQLYIDNIYVGPADNYTSLKGFNLYRNNDKLNDELLTTSRYIDYALESGEYTYVVESVYANGGTARAMTHTITIDLTTPHNAPRELTIAELTDDTLQLQWEAPAAADTERLRYDNGEVFNSIGGDETAYVAVKWDENDIRPYIGYSITALHYHISDNVEGIIPILYEDGKAARMGDEITPETGVFNDYVFSEPLLIREGHNYMAGYRVTSHNGSYPISHDAGPGTAGKSDLYSVDGENWYSLYELNPSSEFSVNWNIAADLDLLESTSSNQFTNSRISKEIVSLSGYNIYMNDIKLNNGAPIKETTLIMQTPTESSEYYVTAVYSDGVEAESEHITFEVSGIAGINSSGIQLYPVPVIHTLNIEGEYDYLSLYSSDGVCVYSNATSSDKAEINMESCAPGIYILKVLKNGQSSTHRIIKR